MSSFEHQAIVAVRAAVERMDGAHWIGVDAQSYPPDLLGWVIAYPRGWCVTPDTPEWCELRQRVESAVTAVLVPVGTPF